MNGSKEQITLCLYQVNFVRDDWCYPLDPAKLADEAASLNDLLGSCGFELSFTTEDAHTIEVSGYSDLLNAVRIRSQRPGLGNVCLGHVIGCSQNLDLLEDIRRGVKRVAFAPETIEPEGSDKVVCHNCGCGC
ncbi:MAG: hypothetical protein C0624_05260 [Desulfuromonas sp.]|nr:MAG: hypothetical protein C0624_05260 [Desulfuromonas sp.]